jgi:hypothetical protein
MLVLSLLLLYQVRILAVIRGLRCRPSLALSVAWQAYLQNERISMVRRRSPRGQRSHYSVRAGAHRSRLDIHREVETVIGAGLSC